MERETGRESGGCMWYEREWRTGNVDEKGNGLCVKGILEEVERRVRNTEEALGRSRACETQSMKEVVQGYRSVGPYV